MMVRFLLSCAVAASLASGAAQARQQAAPAASTSPASVPVAGSPAAGDLAASLPAAVPPAAVTPTVPAPGPAMAPQSMTSGPAAGSLLQTIFALCLVLGLLAGLAWFMKRYGPKAQGGSAHVRLVGALNLGGRERIMVVEVGDQWIVVGASPGRVNALATMPRQASTETGAPGAALYPQQPSASSFSEWLKQTIDKRNAK